MSDASDIAWLIDALMVRAGRIVAVTLIVVIPYHHHHTHFSILLYIRVIPLLPSSCIYISVNLYSFIRQFVYIIFETQPRHSPDSKTQTRSNKLYLTAGERCHLIVFIDLLVYILGKNGKKYTSRCEWQNRRDHPIFGFYASESGQAAVMSYLRNTVKVRGFVM